MRYPRDDGFTLIELMVTVLIIGVLVTICLPVFNSVKTNAQRKACFANERVVEGAYSNYLALHTSEGTGDWDGLMAALVPGEDLASTPECPGGGTYSWDGHLVTCTMHGSYH